MCLNLVICQCCQLSLHPIYLFIWQMGRRHLPGPMLWGQPFSVSRRRARHAPEKQLRPRNLLSRRGKN